MSAGVQIKVTDKAWNGTSFVGGEGILGFTVTEAGGVPQGSVVNYYGTGTTVYGVWDRIAVSRCVWGL